MLLPDSSWQAPVPAPMPLPEDEVHVWRVWLGRPRHELERLEGVLCPEERHRAHRFRSESARQQFVGARGALRAILAGYLSTSAESLVFSHSPLGKPHLVHDGPPVHFNISHSHD